MEVARSVRVAACAFNAVRDFSSRNRRCAVASLADPGLQRRANEATEQRMRRERPTFELRMELAAEKVRMILELHDFYESLVGAHAGHGETGFLKGFTILVVQLVAMAM